MCCQHPAIKISYHAREKWVLWYINPRNDGWIGGWILLINVRRKQKKGAYYHSMNILATLRDVSVPPPSPPLLPPPYPDRFIVFCCFVLCFWSVMPKLERYTKLGGLFITCRYLVTIGSSPPLPHPPIIRYYCMSPSQHCWDVRSIVTDASDDGMRELS